MVKKADTDSDAAQVGRRIAELRNERGLSNEKIADAMGVALITVKKIMGGTGTVQFAKLKRLARALGVTPNDILEVGEGENLDVLFAAVEGSYRVLGLSERDAKALARRIREVYEEPLTPSSKADRTAALRVLAESATIKFLKEASQKGQK
jgi:transcriptional regulator with XRE-family HTH domain